MDAIPYVMMTRRYYAVYHRDATTVWNDGFKGQIKMMAGLDSDRAFARRNPKQQLELKWLGSAWAG
jgi:hypothetical protein